MLKAMSLVSSPKARLRIIGEGPLEDAVREATLRDPRITYLGRVPLRGVMVAMGGACAVLVPSEWYEPFGRVAAEALAVGTPVICAGMGGVAEIVEKGKTGFHVRPLDPADLARVLDLTTEDPSLLDRMRGDARRAYEASYTPELGYHYLMKGYLKAIENSARPASQ